MAFTWLALYAGFILLSACAGSTARLAYPVGSATRAPAFEVDPDASCYVLRDVPLKTFVGKVNRDTTRQLSIHDPAIENSKLGGTVCLSNLDGLVPALQRLGLNVVEVTPPIPSAGDSGSDRAGSAAR